MDPGTAIEMKRAQEMHEFIAGKAAGTYPNPDRLTLFASFFSLAQSHHESILVLCHEHRLVGSAYALFRPLVEAVNRGAFVAFIATEEQVQDIKRGGTPYGNVETLTKRLDDLFDTQGLFAGHAGEAWGTMCGLTHGGIEQLSRRISDKGEIGCHFNPEDVQHLLASSTGVLVKCAIQFLGIERPDASKLVSDKYIALYSTP